MTDVARRLRGRRGIEARFEAVSKRALPRQRVVEVAVTSSSRNTPTIAIVIRTVTLACGLGRREDGRTGGRRRGGVIADVRPSDRIIGPLRPGYPADEVGAVRLEPWCRRRLDGPGDAAGWRDSGSRSSARVARGVLRTESRRARRPWSLRATRRTRTIRARSRLSPPLESKSARGGIRTHGPLRERILSPPPLSRLGHPRVRYHCGSSPQMGFGWHAPDRPPVSMGDQT